MFLRTFFSILDLWNEPKFHLVYWTCIGGFFYIKKYIHKKHMEVYGIRVNNWLADAPFYKDLIVTQQDLK
jgi:hypothetical protein